MHQADTYHDILKLPWLNTTSPNNIIPNRSYSIPKNIWLILKSVNRKDDVYSISSWQSLILGVESSKIFNGTDIHQIGAKLADFVFSIRSAQF